MNTLALLPKLMVAPNGAHLGKADHSQLPLTIDEIAEAARQCQLAGADGIHVHIRDAEGRHLLDAGVYREAIKEITRQAPGMQIQITTEAAGRYQPDAQRQVVYDLQPTSASVAWREMQREIDAAKLWGFYHWAAAREIALQHIFYCPEELTDFLQAWVQAGMTQRKLQCLFVLGRRNKPATPDDITPWINAMHSWRKQESNKGNALNLEWAVCAFGQHETDCLIAAAGYGGKLRIGFENNRWREDGKLAQDNAERVAELVARLRSDVSIAGN